MGIRVLRNTAETEVETIDFVKVYDPRDQKHAFDTITKIAKAGTAHVRRLGSTMIGQEDMYVVSSCPVSHLEALQVFHETEIDCAKNNLRVSKDPHEVLRSYSVSIGEVIRIAEEEGIPLPHDWFQTGEKKMQAGHADAAHAEVERLEGTLTPVKSDLAAAEVRARSM